MIVLAAVPLAASLLAAGVPAKEPSMSLPPSDERVRRANHLAGQTSPYLLQHLHNPVDWYPWGPEAIAKARRENKPILLSIGYAACHWCHVMERESFENEAIARLLNEGFVAIKVDREERPDLDDVYMTAVQLMTGQGGWPLNVFLTPDLEPFYGGTYFPPEDRWGRPGFPTLLARIREAWTGRRDEVARSARELTAHLRATVRPPAEQPGAPPGRAESAKAAAELASRFDERWGGFGSAPKFPPHGALSLLLREHAREGDAVPRRMVETTLDRMLSGGLYDQVGGGFCRYSVDERWLVPHFEKMLYDQALLVPVFVDAWLVTGKPAYRRVVEETLDFVRREMTGPEGGCYASLDADSEGHEGTYYLWTPEEVLAILGEADGRLFCETYGIVPGGNFEGKSIPNLAGGPIADPRLDARLAPLRAALLAARSRRPRPATDDKVLTAWNGLMITAFARAFQAFGRPEDLASARRAADFAASRLAKDGRLRVSYRAGKARLNAYLDDYAFLGRGLVDLYEADFDRKRLDAAAALARTMVARFSDPAGGFYFTSDDHETLLLRTRSLHDGALPSGAGVACELLARLAAHTDDRSFRAAAAKTLAAYRGLVTQAPSAFASWLLAAAWVEGPGIEIAVVGPTSDPRTRALLAAARRPYLPIRAIAASDGTSPVEGLAILEGKKAEGGRPTAYVCRDRVCDAPAFEPEALDARLRAARGKRRE